MKVEVVKLSDLDNYFKFVAKETELKVLMTQLLSNQERNLELLKRIKSVSVVLKFLKSKVDMKLSDDVKKAIRKYSKEV